MGRSPAGIALVLAAAVVAGSTGAAAAPPPRVSAKAYFVRSGVDEAVLAAHDASIPRPIASITKLMTVLVALDHLSLDDVVVVPRAATRIGEATIELRAGERITVRELVQGALIPSANDAATALALVAADGSLDRFVSWMNAEARKLGLADTHFVNPHGLDVQGHASSARDVVTLLRAALANPTILLYAATAQAELPGRGEVGTTDDLLSQYAPLVGGEDRPHRRRRLVRGRGSANGRRRGVRVGTRRAKPGGAQRRPAGASLLGARAVPPRARDRRRPGVRDGPCPIRATLCAARRRAVGRAPPARRRAARRAGDRARPT